MARALLRNTAEIGVPWQRGHPVGVGAAYEGLERRDPWTLVPTALVGIREWGTYRPRDGSGCSPLHGSPAAELPQMDAWSRSPSSKSLC